jgi:tryptophan 2,3-dioxygenase
MSRREEVAVPELTPWQGDADSETFPYDAVVGEFRRVGKHFVSTDLLATLDGLRATRPEAPQGCSSRLGRFLDTALDKHDGRYDNPSYLALAQLALPGSDGRGDDLEHASRQRDRLLALLIADVLRFELEALDGRTDLLPDMRADERIAVKRCRHGLRAVLPALERLGLEVEIDADDPIASARGVCCAVLRSAAPAEHRMLQLTVLHVSQVHDEYMFMRVLQAYETAFALVGVHIKAAVAALEDGNGDAAVQILAAAELAMRESSPLFSLIGTMRTEAFLEFRQYTDGASAIQSRNYKRLESLCRRPDQDRLDSPAYHSVPDVRQRVIAGQANLDDALASAAAAGLLSREVQAEVCAAMRGFEAAVFKWRKTHHSLAAHMLGERRGTGYTEGVGYLEQGKTIPVFDSRCPFGH